MPDFPRTRLRHARIGRVHAATGHSLMPPRMGAAFRFRTFVRVPFLNDLRLRFLLIGFRYLDIFDLLSRFAGVGGAGLPPPASRVNLSASTVISRRTVLWGPGDPFAPFGRAARIAARGTLAVILAVRLRSLKFHQIPTVARNQGRPLCPDRLHGPFFRLWGRDLFSVRQEMPYRLSCYPFKRNGPSPEVTGAEVNHPLVRRPGRYRRRRVVHDPAPQLLCELPDPD